MQDVGRNLRQTFHAALVRAGLAQKIDGTKRHAFLGELKAHEGERQFTLHMLRHTFCSWVDTYVSSHAAVLILSGKSTRSATDRYLRHKSFDSLLADLNRLPLLLPVKRRGS